MLIYINIKTKIKEQSFIFLLFKTMELFQIVSFPENRQVCDLQV